jgi:hypothetical protein
MTTTYVLANPGTGDVFVPGPNVTVEAGDSQTLHLSEYDERAYASVIQGIIDGGKLTGSRTYDVSVPFEALAAGVDIGDGSATNARQVAVIPKRATIVNMTLTLFGAPSGQTSGDTWVMKIYNATSVVKTITVQDPADFPAPGVETVIENLSNTSAVPGTTLRFDIVQGSASVSVRGRFKLQLTETL